MDGSINECLSLARRTSFRAAPASRRMPIPTKSGRSWRRETESPAHAGTVVAQFEIPANAQRPLVSKGPFS